MVQVKNKFDLSRIDTPIILRGDRNIAYRDPAAHYYHGMFRIFHTVVRREQNG